jgi:DNA polymerase-3 subunit alpha
MIKDFPPVREETEQGEVMRGLGVRLMVACQDASGSASAELQLGEGFRFFPTNAALAGWRAQADQGRSEIIYE